MAQKLTFLGATGTVTGSKTLLTAGSTKVLVDSGLFQGLKQLRLRNWDKLPVAPASIDAVVLTHAHIDHSGYLPVLIKNGFRGRVYCTTATRDLCRILLPDAGYLQEEEARYANKKGYSRHRKALPLFTEKDAVAALRRLEPVAFDTEVRLNKALSFRLHTAGHILGAAIVAFEAAGRRLVFSGDLGRSNDPIMRPPAAPGIADFLVVEATYGNRRHPAEDIPQTLAVHLNRALRRGGVVVIPAFAVGRAQALLHYIAQLKQRNGIPDVAVFLNSPMAVDATRIYHNHRAEHRLSAAECDAACTVATMVNSAEDSRELNLRKGPMIIISASGMATGGRVLHHLKAFASDARNMVLFPGFQAAGTRGAAMLGGAESIKIHGAYVPVLAEVVGMDSLSAHADYSEILAWLGTFPRPPKTTFITHGEPAAADELRRRIEETLGWSCCIPDYLDSAVLQ
jgi:metallo-beta-lactamase family protein